MMVHSMVTALFAERGRRDERDDPLDVFAAPFGAICRQGYLVCRLDSDGRRACVSHQPKRAAL